MNKDDWSKQICEMHQIEPKLRVISMLHDKFEEFGKELEKLEFKEYTNKRARMGEQQEIETLINEEAFLLAQYLRNEKKVWALRIVNMD
jgi:protein associated with RNAse G/E